MLIYTILLILLSISSYTDLFYKRIYNFITLPAIVLGILLNAVINGSDGLTHSLIGIVLGFSLYFTLYMLGGIGGGDVKLMSAVGALIGWKLLIWSIAFSSVVGGAMAIAVLLKRRLFLITLQRIAYCILSLIIQTSNTQTPNTRDTRNTRNTRNTRITNSSISETAVRIPYGIAIAIGTIITILIKVES